MAKVRMTNFDKLDDKLVHITFADVQAGEIFRHGNVVFLKFNENLFNGRNSVCIFNGSVVKFEDDDAVDVYAGDVMLDERLMISFHKNCEVSNYD